MNITGTLPWIKAPDSTTMFGMICIIKRKVKIYSERIKYDLGQRKSYAYFTKSVVIN